MVISVWGSRRHHKCSGKLGFTHSAAMKWFLNVRIALSAALRRCMPGGASWKSISASTRNCFRSVDASLSSLWSCGRSPAAVSLLYSLAKARKISVADLFFNGSTKMQLLS